MQLRYLDENGMEIVRIDRDSDKSIAYLVSKNKLQNKRERYYFKESENLKIGEFWYSKLDLNVEHGKIEEPLKPVLRIATPVVENGEKKKMSTRQANFVTLDELMDEVGVDVTRYFFLMRNMHAHLNFDLTLAKTQSDENPVFYIQYAHARICSILSLAEARNIDLSGQAGLELLAAPEEIQLIKHLIQLPAVVQASAENFEPHRLVNYLFELATLFHKFYTVCRVISDERDLTRSRLQLIRAVRIVIANGLGLLGISAPQHMSREE